MQCIYIICPMQKLVFVNFLQVKHYLFAMHVLQSMCGVASYMLTVNYIRYYIYIYLGP